MEEVKILRQLLLIASFILISLSFVLEIHPDNAPGRLGSLDLKLNELRSRFADTKAVGVFVLPHLHFNYLLISLPPVQ